MFSQSHFGFLDHSWNWHKWGWALLMHKQGRALPEFKSNLDEAGAF